MEVLVSRLGQFTVPVPVLKKIGVPVKDAKDLCNADFGIGEDVKNASAWRADKRLIAAMKEFGLEWAHCGKGCSSKILEIPDDVDWYVDNSHQDFECVREHHRVWGYITLEDIHRIHWRVLGPYVATVKEEKNVVEETCKPRDNSDDWMDMFPAYSDKTGA